MKLSEFFCGAETGVMNNARLALDASAFEQVAVEAAAFILSNKARHKGRYSSTAQDATSLHNTSYIIGGPTKGI
jgi:hypothetical protein